MFNTCYLKEVKLKESLPAGNYWNTLPFYLGLLNGENLTFDSSVTFLIGENGCGKSTLLEAIAIALGYNAEGGSKNFNFSTRNTASSLFDELITVKGSHEKDGFFLRAESFYNVATNIEDLNIGLDSYGGKSLHHQSHGESFLSLIQNRFRGNGLYILDEPEAALSPMRQLTLLIEINELATHKNSQFIIATHSPVLLALPYAKIYCLDKGINQITYKESEHYQILTTFLNNPERYLRQLIPSVYLDS